MTAWCLADGSGTGRTATGVVPLAGYTVAADWAVYAPGTVLLVLGLGVRVVEDRGSKVRGAQLDDYHGADAAACASAKAWGRQAREVLVLHRPTGRSADAVKNVSAQAKVRAGERGNSPAHLPLVEGASGAGHLAQAGRERTAPGARAGLTEPAAAHRALAGAPRAGALSTSSSEPIEARR
jgi:3D (Asp-Asp-Asp) domain-containing protein